MLDFQIITYCYGCEVILHCDSWLSLLTNGDKQVVTCLLAIRISYFVKCLLKFLLIVVRLFVVLLQIDYNFLYILEYFASYMHCKYFLPVCFIFSLS